MGQCALTAEQVRELLIYDRDTGILRWRVRPARHIPAGAVAGAKRPDGYVQLRIRRKFYYAHRLAWIYVHGQWPHQGIDHIDGDPTNNRIANLREATQEENLQNMRGNSRNKIQLRGVSWVPHENRYYARINVNRSTHYLGSFKDAAAAHDAYVRAKCELHPFHPSPPTR